MITVFGKNKTLSDLHSITLERPERAGKYWKGIQHGELADVILDECRSRGWNVKDTQFSVSDSGSEMAGAFLLETPKIKVPEGQTLALGVLTSNAMKRSLKMVVGTNVTVCNNGMATGEVVLNRKHTTGCDLFDEIEQGIDQYIIKASGISKMVSSLRERELSSQEVEHLLMEAGRRGYMPWSQIGKVDKEYQQPRFEEHGTGTSWALLNAFTYVVKERSPMNQMQLMNSFRETLPIAA